MDLLWKYFIGHNAIEGCVKYLMNIEFFIVRYVTTRPLKWLHHCMEIISASCKTNIGWVNEYPIWDTINNVEIIPPNFFRFLFLWRLNKTRSVMAEHAPFSPPAWERATEHRTAPTSGGPYVLATQSRSRVHIVNCDYQPSVLLISCIPDAIIKSL